MNATEYVWTERDAWAQARRSFKWIVWRCAWSHWRAKSKSISFHYDYSETNPGKHIRFERIMFGLHWRTRP